MKKTYLIIIALTLGCLLIGFGIGRIGISDQSHNEEVQIYFPDTFILSEEDASPVVQWNQIFLSTIAAEQVSPPEASRYLAMLHRAMRTSLQGMSKDMDPDRIIGYVGERMYHEIFPDYKNILLNPGEDAALYLDEKGFAVSVVNNQLDLRQLDNSSTYKGYSIKDEIGLWRATPPYFFDPLLPQWGDVTLFAASVEDITLDAPPSLDSAQYASEYKEVKEWGGVESAERKTEEAEIAKYWADGKGTYTPPGHWNLIAQNVLAENPRSLQEEVEIFAVLNTALADAAIGAWHNKFLYEYWRPIDAIRHADKDGNDETEPDTAWFNFIETPNFPEYPSGHSAFSAAGAESLTHFFGKRTSFSSHTLGLPSVVRSFNSFDHAAEEAGMSRIYGGIHFQSANTQGMVLGRSVAQKAIAE